MAFGIRTNGSKRQAASAAARSSGADPQEVARVAYDLYVQRGCADGHDLEDWLRAEAIVNTRQRAPQTARSRR